MNIMTIVTMMITTMMIMIATIMNTMMTCTAMATMKKSPLLNSKLFKQLKETQKVKYLDINLFLLVIHVHVCI